MNNEDVHPAGAPTVGSAGPSVRNVSGETKTIGSTVRHTERAADGKFSRTLPHREPTLVRETVTGQMLPGPSNAVLARENDGLASERLHRIAPDYSGGRAISAAFDTGTYSSEVTGARGLPVDPAWLSNPHLTEDQALLNHVIGCKRCAAGTCAVMGG